MGKRDVLQPFVREARTRIIQSRGRDHDMHSGIELRQHIDARGKASYVVTLVIHPRTGEEASVEISAYDIPSIIAALEAAREGVL